MEPRGVAAPFLQHPENEAASAAIARLEAFAQAAKRAGIDRGLTVTRGQPMSVAETDAIATSLGAPLTTSLAAWFHSVGSVAIKAACCELTTLCTAEDLDFDTYVGTVLDDEFYADLRAEGSPADDDVVRVSLAHYFFRDANEHEDGDAALLVLPCVGGAEVPVFQLPEDDGYEHGQIGADVHQWCSKLVDRVITCIVAPGAGSEGDGEREDQVAGRCAP